MKSEWTKKKLSDIADFNPRETIKKGAIAKKIPMDVLRPFYRDIPYYVEECFSGGTKFRNGDTIMARITPCLENGKTAQVSILNDGEVGFGSTEYIVFRAKEGIADKDYLYYLVCSPEVREPAIKSMVGSSGRQRVQTDVVKNLEIDVPPLVEQEKIGSFLKAFDDKIALNDRINKNLEQQAQALFKSWFLDYEPWDGSVPDSWNHGKLGDFAEIKRGGSPRPIQEYLSDSGLRWLKISDVTSLQTPFVIDIKDHIIEAGLRKTVFLKAGSLVLSNSATPGVPKILDVDSCIHDGWLYFPESKFSKEYLYLYFKYIRQQLVNLSNGSVFNNLKTDILKRYPTILPDKETLRRFDDIVIPMFLQMQNLTRESHKLADMRDALLPKLMSGELDISDINL
jgi:type I restriction enzyme S subunit